MSMSTLSRRASRRRWSQRWQGSPSRSLHCSATTFSAIESRKSRPTTECSLTNSSRLWPKSTAIRSGANDQNASARRQRAVRRGQRHPDAGPRLRAARDLHHSDDGNGARYFGQPAEGEPGSVARGTAHESDFDHRRRHDLSRHVRRNVARARVAVAPIQSDRSQPAGHRESGREHRVSEGRRCARHAGPVGNHAARSRDATGSEMNAPLRQNQQIRKRASRAQLRRYAPMLVIGGAVATLALGLVLLIKNLATEETKPAKKVVQVQVFRPPPPPPPEVEPPPPEIKEEVDVPEPEPVVDSPEVPDVPPGEQLGLDAEGVAGADAFGLVGRKGGRDLLAGGSRNQWYAGR